MIVSVLRDSFAIVSMIDGVTLSIQKIWSRDVSQPVIHLFNEVSPHQI